MFEDDGFSAMEAGAAYALGAYALDNQTRQIVDALGRTPGGATEVEIDVHVHNDNDLPIPPINVLDWSTIDIPNSWDDFVGQVKLKQQMAIYIGAAKAKGERLGHTLFASGYPGVGKTTVARLTAKALGVDMIELVPPFKVQTIVDAALQLVDGDIVFIDEVHKLADHSKGGAEILLKILEDGVAFVNGEAVVLPDVTFIGATTDKDKLPQTVLDRFLYDPYFDKYDDNDLARIVIKYAKRQVTQGKWSCLDAVTDELAGTISVACRSTPRIAEKMARSAWDLAYALDRPANPNELLEFVDVEADGMTRTHIHYITALYQFFPKEKPKGGGIEYIIGEAGIKQILRETTDGLLRIESFLIERGLINRTTRGRALTDMGIAFAQDYVAQGKGSRDVA